MISLPNLDVLTNLGALTSLGIVNLVIVAIILLVFCLWLVSKLSEARLKKVIAKESDQSLSSQCPSLLARLGLSKHLGLSEHPSLAN